MQYVNDGFVNGADSRTQVVTALRHHLQKPFRGTSGPPLKKKANFFWETDDEKKGRGGRVFSFASFFGHWPSFFSIKATKGHF